METGNSILKKKDFKEVFVAQKMINTANMQQAREQRTSFSKRKQSIIKIFLSQPSKPALLQLTTVNRIGVEILHLVCVEVR